MTIETPIKLLAVLCGVPKNFGQIQKGYLKNKILDYSSFEDDDNIDDNVNDANNNINTEEKANVFIINTDGKNGSADTKLSTKEGRTSDLDLEESKNGIIEDTLNHGYVDLSINDDYYLDGTKEIIYNICFCISSFTNFIQSHSKVCSE